MTRSSELTRPAGHQPGPSGGRRRRGPRRANRSAEHHPAAFPLPQLAVEPWPDPVLDVVGHDPRSLYVERYWLPIVGPSSLLLLRRLARGLEQEPEGFRVDPAELAAELGLGARGGAHGPFWRAIDRAGRFGLARRDDQLLVVRRKLPPLTSRQVRRLPPRLAGDHTAWQNQQLLRPRRLTIAHWSDHRPTPPAGPPPSRSPLPDQPEADQPAPDQPGSDQ